MSITKDDFRTSVLTLALVAPLAGTSMIFQSSRAQEVAQPATAAAPPCVGCGDLGLESRRTGIPEIDEQIHLENLQKIRAAKEVRLAEAWAKLRIQRDIWQGSDVQIPQYDPADEWVYRSSKADNPDFVPPPRRSAAELAELGKIVKIFEAEPAFPRERQQAFAKYHAADARINCNGLRVAVKDATAVSDGWVVNIVVVPKLVAETGRPMHADGLHTKEVWHVTRDGDATVQSVRAFNLDATPQRF